MFCCKWFEPKAFNQGYLPEMDGHLVYFQEFGNHKGIPVLAFHGGPGGSFGVRFAKSFDLKKYRIIGFDQRGGGKSLPAGQWNHNTTADLIKDADRLLEYLNVKDNLILTGGSWGSTLALKFAETYPKRVDKMLLSRIFLANEKSQKWEEEDCIYFYPDIIEQLKQGVSEWETMAEYYAKMICSGEGEKQEKALSYYGMYERLRSSLDPKIEPVEVTEKNLAEARVYINYAAKRFYLKDDELIKNIKKIAKIPTLIVHNRRDFVCPPEGAYRLHKVMPNSRLVIVPEDGHGGKLIHKVLKREVKEFLA